MARIQGLYKVFVEGAVHCLHLLLLQKEDHEYVLTLLCSSSDFIHAHVFLVYFKMIQYKKNKEGKEDYFEMLYHLKLTLFLITKCTHFFVHKPGDFLYNLKVIQPPYHRMTYMMS